MVILIATLMLHYRMLWLPRSNQSRLYTLYIQACIKPIYSIQLVFSATQCCLYNRTTSDYTAHSECLIFIPILNTKCSCLPSLFSLLRRQLYLNLCVYLISSMSNYIKSDSFCVKLDLWLPLMAPGYIYLKG